MSESNLLGRINSIQSLGTVDGPGIRFVVFMQGCNLRCGYCHNPDTWSVSGGTEITAEELINKAVRFKSYFQSNGGITVSGGEPLLQSEFVTELFRLCHKNGINTCLDTSGSILNSHTEELLEHTDRVLLDIKFTNDKDYKEYTGCSLNSPLFFLEALEKRNIPVTIRHVIIPTLNDKEESILKLKNIAKKYSCIDKIELLPFKKICKVKYDNMGIDFPFDKYPAADSDSISSLNKIISN